MDEQYEANLKTLIRHNGKQEQYHKALEELGELTSALAKYINYGGEEYEKDLTQEMADAEIMLDQLKLMVGNRTKVAEIKRYKLARTFKRYGLRMV